MAALPDIGLTVKCGLVRDAARVFGEARLQLSGASMLPSLWPGDVLRIRSCAFSEPEPGDIVQFFREGLFITHRVVAKGPGFLVTRGDRNRRDDAPVVEGEFLGRVVSIERNGRPVDPVFTPRLRVGAWFLRWDWPVRVLLRIGRFVVERAQA